MQTPAFSMKSKILFLKIGTCFTLCRLEKCKCFFLSSVDFFHNKSFQKIISGIS